jgi:hypothetical protein
MADVAIGNNLANGRSEMMQTVGPLHFNVVF